MSATSKLHYFRYLHVLYRITTLEKSETLDSLPHDFAETGLHLRHFPVGGFREGVQGARAAPPPFPPQFFLELRTSKIYKTNINKIYLIKLRLKEMTCLMIIAKTKKTFSAFQLLYSGSGKPKKQYQPVTRTG